MLDVLVTGGTVVDGTGAPGVRADVGVRDGRVVAVGDVDEPATTTVDADGLIVAPGFIDPHTHYDAQLFWDPAASPSNIHGVTTVIGGNCGFTLAPLEAEDADYLRRMMAKVEGMPLGCARERPRPGTGGPSATTSSRLDGNLGVNAGFLVGHCALRRTVMDDDAVGGTPSRRAARQDAHAAARVARRRRSRLLDVARRTPTPTATASPVPSRHATPDEVLALCEVVQRARRHDARVHHRRLPQRVQRRRDGPHGADVRDRAPTAQLERAHRRLRRPGQDRAPARGLDARRGSSVAASSRSRCRRSSA